LSTPTTDEPCRSKKPRRKYYGSLVPEMEGHRWGLVELASKAITHKNGYRYVLVRCTGCGTEKLISYDNLTSWRTRGCQSCSQKCGAPTWLLQRMESARQRCTNPNDAGYSRYGGRGITFEFPTVATAAVWVMENLGLHKSMELDRIDNNQGYKPGNLRFVHRRLNVANQNRCHSVEFHKFRTEYPEVQYADNTLRDLLSKGLTPKQIVERWNTPSCKPKGRYGTFSTADPAIASLQTGA
jgi:hypothetical protein